MGGYPRTSGRFRHQCREKEFHLLLDLEGYADYLFPTPMPKPPGSPSPPPPSALNCWLWIVVSDESIHFFGVLRGFLPHNLSVEFESAFFEQGFNRPARTATVGLISNHSRNAERNLVVRLQLLLFTSLSAPEECPKDDHQLVLYPPRTNRRRAVRRNVNEPNGHLQNQARNFHTHSQVIQVAGREVKGIRTKGSMATLPKQSRTIIKCQVCG